MAPKTPEKTTQVTEVKLPEWVDKASQENYQFAQQVANKPYEAYTGKTVADTSQGFLDSYKQFYGTMGQAGAGLNKASEIFSSLGNTNLGRTNVTDIKADQITPEMLADADLSKYMNPYIDNVESKALGALNDSRIQSLMSNADKAVAAKAFGGSRSAIVDAVTNSESNKAAGLLSADLRKQAYDQAVSGATGDITRKMQAQGANQSANLAAAQSNQNASLQSQIANIEAALKEAGVKSGAAQGLVGISEEQQKQRLQDFMGLQQIGQQQQGQSQSELDDLKSRWDEKQGYDTERLNLLLSSLGMSPYGQQQTTQTTRQPASSGMDWGTMGLGIFSLLLGLSDERAKTNKKKVGSKKLKGKSVPIYEYNYKGDPTKMRGPMAQDIEKVAPEKVANIGGMKFVDRPTLKKMGHRRG